VKVLCLLIGWLAKFLLGGRGFEEILVSGGYVSGGVGGGTDCIG